MLKGFGSHFRFTGRGSIAAFVLRPLPIAAVASLGLFAAQASAAKPDLERSCARYVADGVRVAECVDQLRLARDATAKYRDPQAALRDGFVPGECVDSTSEGEDPALGAMGEHWLRVDRMGDQKLDPREPEILLYISTPTGRRLVGAEWSIAALEGGLPHYGTQPPDPNRTSPPPRMFGGRAFDGPMQGHNLVHAWPSELHLTPQPWHYDLHLWLWEENPAGVFAQYNRRVSCKHGVAPEGAGGSGAGSPRRWTCPLQRLRLTVSPRRAGAGKRTRFRFRATAGRKPVRGVRIRFAGRRVRTGRSGRAELAKRLSRSGRYRVIATKRNFVRATATVRVVR
jgi:hypothetical protein